MAFNRRSRVHLNCNSTPRTCPCRSNAGIPTLKWLTVALAILIALPITAVGQNDVEQLEQQALYEAASEASKYVVRIETLGGLEKVGRVLVNNGPTSGVVVDADGFIVSSAFNFVQEPSSIIVKLPNGERKAAKIVSRDASRKLVLLSVEVDEPLDVPIAASVQHIRVGQWAITVGRTLPGDGFNMSVGIVSALNRIWGKAIQTDANVSPTNYGGALVDIRGRIMGILVPLSPDSNSDVAGAEWYDSGIGFAVPLETVFAHLPRWKDGDLYSGKLGVAMKGTDIYGEELVIGVCRPKSPARDAGLAAGDRILSMNGIPVRRHVEMKHVLGPLLAGDTVSIEYVRDGEELSTEVVLTDKLVPYEHPFLGILPIRTTEEREPAGVQVRYIYPDSAAAELGLQVDDVIKEVNGEAVADAVSLRTALAGFEPGDVVQIGFTSGVDALSDSITLSAMPTAVPAELPAILPDVDELNEDLPPLGKVNVKLPEEAGECLAYVPETYDPRFPHSLLVLLPIPGKQNAEDLLKVWQQACDDSHTILLMPQAKGARNWLPTETAFIRKTIENVRREYSIDPERVVVCGGNNSGAMAFVTAFSHRDLIRGVASLNSPIPRRAPVVFNEPLQRLAAFFVGPTKGLVARRIEQNVEQLGETKIPVVHKSTDVEELDDQLRGELLRWIDSLDRI